MRTEIPVPSGFMERQGIRSGVMDKEGQPNYGVVFSESASPSEDDFDAALILGADIESAGAPESQSDRYFKILGGYLFRKTGDGPRTTKVFGIALNPEFGVTEGGSTTLMDNWHLDDPKRPGLDEMRSDRDGWTFIVAPKDDPEKFPHSSDPLKISVACPDITGLSVKIGDCVGEQRKVTFDFSIGETEPKTWRFTFGDGQEESGEGRPPESIEHLYSNKPSNPPELCLTGHQACEKTCREVSLSEFDAFEPCVEERICPDVRDIQITVGATDTHTMTKTVNFNCVVSGVAPERFEWDFGDGHTETTTATTVSHAYPVPASGSSNYSVTVTAYGPGDCKDSAKRSVDIPSKEIPKLCFFLPLIVAFLMAKTFGAFIMHLAAACFDLGAADWLLHITLILAALTIIAIIAWVILAKKKGCDAPGMCSWMGIFGAALLAAGVVALFLTGCCEAWWWLVILVLLAAAIFLIWTWHRKCSVEKKNLIAHIVVALLAAFLCWFIASNCFKCLQGGGEGEVSFLSHLL